MSTLPTLAIVPENAAPASAPPQPGLRVAETDRRFYAFVVDRLIGWGIDLAVALVASHYLLSRGHLLAGVLLIAATVLVVGAGFALLLGVTGSTPGKAFCGLRVIDPRTGRPIGAGPALLRSSIVGGATAPFGFGLAALAWTALADPDHLRRGWHDRVVPSLVVGLRPLPVVEEVDDDRPRTVVNLTAMRLVPARRTPSAPDPAQVPARAPSRERPVRATPDPAPQVVPPAWGLVFDTGDRVRVETIVLIGRRPERRPDEEGARLVGLPSSDMSVSKTHAQVVAAPDGTLVVTDRGSTDGTVLRRQGVTKPLAAGRPATLLDGDVVNLGDRTMTVVRVS